MRLWESYFRLWRKISDSLSEESTQSPLRTFTGVRDSVRDNERDQDYYGYFCNRDLCVESGG
jgi:hypothetical protein